MIELKTLAKSLQDKLNANQNQFQFHIVADTGRYKKPIRDLNNVIEIVNGRLTLSGSDVSSVSTGAIFTTQNCTLKIIMKMTQNEEDVLDENGKLIDYGNESRIESMRSYLDGVFKQNTVDMLNVGGKSYVVSTVYSFAQSGIRAQDARLGDSFTFSAEIYYTFVEQGMNARSAVFTLDDVIIPYQSFTMYRTPTMDGNVYSNSKNAATKNLSSQSVFSISFELPALADQTTQNMLEYLLSGDLNQAHILKVAIGEKTAQYLVQYGENTLTGEIVLNLGQSLSLVECIDDYDLITFGKSYYIYQLKSMGVYRVYLPNEAQAYAFCENNKNNGFLTIEDGSAKVNMELGDILVSTRMLTDSIGWTQVQ